MEKRKFLLVEDDHLLRVGLKSMIETHGEYTCISDVATGREALRSFRMKPADIVMLDLLLPDIAGTEVLKKLRNIDKQAKVIILTVCEDNDFLYEALEFGTNAYVLKNENPEEIFMAIKYVLEDEIFISPRLTKNIVKDYIFATRQRKCLSCLQNLTSREIEVVKLVFEGRKSRQIAEILSISLKTVDKHRSNILRKIGLNTFNELRHGGIYLLDILSRN